MCITLPRVLITVAGIEKLVPTWQDLEVFLSLLPRSSTGERMNPYTSIWSGVREGDGPQEFHLVLLDNGRTNVLADAFARQTLQCIRCSACLNVCPVYERTGGHAYESVYPGPIGAILSPQLFGFERSGTLPWASSLCGACYEVCPVKIDIPSVLVHVRGKVVRERKATFDAEASAMKAVAWAFSTRRRYERAQRLARLGQFPLARGRERIEHLPAPLSGWTRARDLKAVPPQSFREWWRARATDEARPGPATPEQRRGGGS
jgi:L-lactate dehydrogenase complex protein LldF